ncbi:unnamed protein product [Dovyalis caffra]|uniref:rRNA N-glycosylase n=1 Tax=Dovyalis caffra TaxID=77055 RepID=A0AAV1RVF6_9ROSI|nr:unnamed protein product [Dovyalis caffra]
MLDAFNSQQDKSLAVVIVFDLAAAVRNRDCCCCDMACALSFLEEETLLRQGTKSSYTTFVSSLRDKLKGNEEYYGIPMLPEPSKATDPEQRFLLVGLNVTKEKSITLALDVNNVYVVGYLDDKYRAHVFSDASKIAEDSLWKDAKERLPIKYPSTYGGIEGKANPRPKVELGIEKLKFAILSVFGKQQIKENLEAKLLLLSVQMVSEATRFKYIEKMILNSIEGKGTYKSFFPNPLVISLENRWQDLSKGVRNSNKGVISPAVQLIDPNNKPFKVDKVQAVAPYLNIYNIRVL